MFWYSGRNRNEKHEKERKKIESIGFTIRDKDTKFFKRNIAVDVTCPECQHQHKFLSKKNGLPKANCDVELTVDCLELAEKDAEFILFTGDGDFRYLIETLHKKGVKVRLISTRKKDKYGDYRFSTRLKELLEESDGEWIYFMELDNLKYKLSKDATNEELENENIKKPPRSVTVPNDNISIHDLNEKSMKSTA